MFPGPAQRAGCCGAKASQDPFKPTCMKSAWHASVSSQLRSAQAAARARSTQFELQKHKHCRQCSGVLLLLLLLHSMGAAADNPPLANPRNNSSGCGRHFLTACTLQPCLQPAGVWARCMSVPAAAWPGSRHWPFYCARCAGGGSSVSRCSQDGASARAPGPPHSPGAFEAVLCHLDPAVLLLLPAVRL